MSLVAVRRLVHLLGNSKPGEVEGFRIDDGRVCQARVGWVLKCSDFAGMESLGKYRYVFEVSCSIHKS